MAKDTLAPRATLYRMVMEDHLCPSGLKAKDLLEREGFDVDDRPLTNRDEVDALKARLGVKTTPQVFLGEERVGGYEALRKRLGKRVSEGTSYRPVLAIFAVAALIALAISWRVDGTILQGQVVPWFVATAMVLLGLQKLQDVESFSTMFLNYDLLARRWVPYGKIYPFVETGAGLLMLAGLLQWLAVPAMLFIGTIGAVSVFKAVYVDKRELKCACVGGGSNVPLGFVSLTENLAMMGMGLWGLSQLL
ncbi:MAG: MauE/DoxX family redox-associated membrane protein [Pseudomonadota bacterium]